MENDQKEKQCRWNIAWVGRCKSPAMNGSDCCEKHQKVCCSCGAPATRECEETGQFVCGASLCDDCRHLRFPSGHNGGVGFNAYPLPVGYTSRHIKKSEQPEWTDEQCAAYKKLCEEKFKKE